LQACREALNKPVKDELSSDSRRAAAAKVLDAAQEALVRGQVSTAWEHLSPAIVSKRD